MSTMTYPRKVINGVLDFQVRSPTNLMLEKILKELDTTTTQSFASRAFHIFSCLEETERVHLPHEALDQASWNSLLLCFVSISVFTVLLFGRSKNKWIKSIARNMFFFYSHLLFNNVTNVVGVFHSRRASWRLLLSGWLLGGTLFLHQCYLCNLKGEMTTGKTIQYIDTLEDVFNRPDIEEYYARQYVFYDHFKKIWTPEIEKFMNTAKIDGPLIHRKSAFLGPFSDLAYLHGHSPNCKNVYQGQKEYLPMTANIIISANLPLFIQETIKYRVSRFVETRQRGPGDIRRNFLTSHIYQAESNIPWKLVAMSFLMPIFRVWFFGTALSVTVFTLESVHRHFIAIKKRQCHAKRKPSFSAGAFFRK